MCMSMCDVWNLCVNMSKFLIVIIRVQWMINIRPAIYTALAVIFLSVAMFDGVILFILVHNNHQVMAICMAVTFCTDKFSWTDNCRLAPKSEDILHDCTHLLMAGFICTLFGILSTFQEHFVLNASVLLFSPVFTIEGGATWWMRMTQTRNRSEDYKKL